MFPTVMSSIDNLTASLESFARTVAEAEAALRARFGLPTQPPSCQPTIKIEVAPEVPLPAPLPAPQAPVADAPTAHAEVEPAPSATSSAVTPAEAPVIEAPSEVPTDSVPVEPIGAAPAAVPVELNDTHAPEVPTPRFPELERPAPTRTTSQPGSAEGNGRRKKARAG
jgi:DNA polymerase III subunit gamma/tau